MSFFWYGCCNSIETIQRFWNFRPRKQEEQEITNEEKEVYWTFIEVLVNQLTELTRFLMKMCLKKCTPSSFYDTDLYGSERVFVVRDTVNKSILAKLVDSRNTQGKFSYIGWAAKWDEWIDMSSSRISRFSPEVPPRVYANRLDSSKFYDSNLKKDIIDGKISYNDVQALIKIDGVFQKAGDYIKILMRCDLYGIELGNEIQKLMSTAQFLVRVFGLKLGRAIMPKNVLEDIRESANVRNAWKEHEAWLAEERKRNEEVDAHWKEWEDNKILLRKQEARKALKQDIGQL